MARILSSIPLHPEAEHSNFREYSKGERFGAGLNLKPAPYLPIVKVDSTINAGVVIRKGTFVTLDENGFIVPAFIGDKTLTYTDIDVSHGVIDIDTDAAVTQAKTSTKTLGTDAADVKIGKPVGVVVADVYKNYDDPWFEPQKGVTILTDYLVLVGVDSAHNAVTYTPGDLLILDDSGFPVPLGVMSDIGDSEKLHYVVGKLVKIVDVTAEPMFTGGLEYVEYEPESFATGLPGAQTNGISDGIDLTTKKGLLIQLRF